MLFQNIFLYKNQKNLFRDSLQGKKTNITGGQGFLLELPYLNEIEFLLKHIHIFPDAETLLEQICTFFSLRTFVEKLIEKMLLGKIRYNNFNPLFFVNGWVQCQEQELRDL